jgi:hypothetical protein
MKRRSLRGRAFERRLAQSLVAHWGSDSVHTIAFTYGSKYFRHECYLQISASMRPRG